MKALPKRKGNECADGVVGHDAGASMKALPKRKGNYGGSVAAPGSTQASMKALPNRKGNPDIPAVELIIAGPQ